MHRVDNLEEGISQSTLSVGLEYNMEVNSRPADEWPRVSQLTGMSCQVTVVLDFHVTPRYDGRRAVGEEHYGEEEEHNKPEVRYECRR